MAALSLRLTVVAGSDICVELFDGATRLDFDEVPNPGLPDTPTIRALLDNTNASADVPAMAKRLGDVLMPPKVRATWMAAGPQRTACDIDPTLQYLPWEMAATTERLFLNYPFFRKATGAAPPAMLDWPLRILVVLAASDAELEELKCDEEFTSIKRLLHGCNRNVHLVRLNQPDRDRIRKELKLKPHVLHFVGHAEPTGLQLYVKGVGRTSWTAQAIQTDLTTAGFSPPLVYLNACRTSVAAQTPLGMSQLSTAFFAKGTRAVVAMHGDISGERSAKCAKAFYEAVAQDADIDAALSRARVAVEDIDKSNQPGISEFVHPYLPALLVQGSPADVLPRRTGFFDKPPKVKIRNAELTRIVHELVNHEECRTGLLSSVAGPAPPNVSLVSGAVNTGKSWMLAWCMDGWLRRNHAVRYVTMAHCHDWLDAMHRILRGDASLGKVGEPLPVASKQFEAGVLELARVKVRKNAKFDIQTLDRKRIAQDAAGTLLNSALHAEIATGKRLCLVLDQFATESEAMNPVDFKALWENWIEPHVVPASSRVRLVLGVRPGEISIPEGIAKPVPVGLFSADNCRELIEEIIWLRYRAKFDALGEKIRQELENLPPEALTAAELVDRAASVVTIVEWRNRGTR